MNIPQAAHLSLWGRFESFVSAANETAARKKMIRRDIPFLHENSCSLLLQSQKRWWSSGDPIFDLCRSGVL
jgi:hypothetical protein